MITSSGQCSLKKCRCKLLMKSFYRVVGASVVVVVVELK